ncbi:rhomboid family intramembrane serine protease [Cytophagaceae bacterium DM2B3-1]|uniref:Rhomboid family intramembrane serine protease n=1 Tax=Xanthocytophaga flava TaxID=3048013 RepID=A0ABT7CCJ4_9BACT|nr:rhomboid family intramembrane serine protease [Xanthocytophaga flavus]MDJ1470119.1 rhomboid family intramembrane serine protease [Xanthocytophaga flavus]MDJ1491318.1 rhomboid family intramembrane serine protease [Xanthocytophaga flavus]
MVRNLLLITIVIFFLQGLFDLIPKFALYPFLSNYFIPFQLVTYIFLHGGLGHIFSNMFGLVMFGPMLERVWGPSRFLIFYLITGIGAGLIHNGINYYEVVRMEKAANVYLMEPTASNLSTFTSENEHLLSQRFTMEFLDKFDKDPNNPDYIQLGKKFVRDQIDEYLNNPNLGTVGASGALFGIMAAFALLFPNTELLFLFLPIPIKAKYFVLLYGIYEYYSGIHRTEGDNVAHFAHLGGMLFGFILVKLWGTDRQRFY